MSADQKLKAIENLMSKVSYELAHLVSVVPDKSDNDALDAISGSLADIVSAMEKRSSTPIPELIAAIKSLRLSAPVVNVTHDIQVSPTPIQVLPAPVQIMPAPVQIMPAKGCDYEVVPSYDMYGAITKMLITRVKSNG